MRFSCLQSYCAALVLVASFGTGPSHANDARQIALEGDIHYRDGQYGEAREAYSRALSVDPRSAKALNNRALTLLQLGDLAAAAEDLSKALDAAPTNGTIWNNRANVNCALKRVEESVAAVLAAGRSLTYDLAPNGKGARCSACGDAIAREMLRTVQA